MIGVCLQRAEHEAAGKHLFVAVTKGLSTAYPVKQDAEDVEGWLFQAGYPPSYAAFGRVRGALTVEICRSLQARRVLEVAAGGGGLVAALACSGADVTANDLREDVLRHALREYQIEGGGSVRIAGGNMFDLSPDELGVFDLVVACEVIEHVAHPDQLLAHLARFVAPGGRIVLTTPNGRFFRNELPTFDEVPDPDQLEKSQFRPDADGHLFLLTANELDRLASRAGLALERVFVWATPALTGHGGCRLIAGRWFVPVARAAEWVVQRLPQWIRERACYSLVAVMVRR